LALSFVSRVSRLAGTMIVRVVIRVSTDSSRAATSPFVAAAFDRGRNHTIVCPNIFVPVVRNWRSQRRAHANSIPRIASPAGITTKAGPGSTIMKTPISTTVPPMSAIAQRLAHV